MKSCILTTWALLITVFAFDVIGAYSDGVHQSCLKGEFYNENTEQCESCTECIYPQYESRKCTPYDNTVCSWCGAINVKKNRDHYIKCVSKHRKSIDEMKFMKKFRAKFVDSFLVADNEKVSDEVIDVEQLPDRRTLPPLPTDDDYDEQEYNDNDILAPIKLGVPASEEELRGKEILLRDDIQPLDNMYDRKKKTEESDFLPISANQLLRDEELNDQEDIENDLEEDNVQPVNVNEALIGQENEFSSEDDELLQHKDRISIVTIAFQKKQSHNDVSNDDVLFNSSYISVCHTIGIYLYLASFVILLGILLKRCYKTDDHVPKMNFTDDQRAMINRCAHNLMKKGKAREEAFYDNDAYAYI